MAKPDLEELERSRKLPEILENLLSEETIANNQREAAEAVANIADMKNDLATAAQAFEKMITKGKRKPIEAGCGAVVAVINQEQEMLRDFTDTVQQHAEALANRPDVASEPLPQEAPPTMEGTFGASAEHLLAGLSLDEDDELEISSVPKDKAKVKVKQKADLPPMNDDIEHSVAVDGNEVSKMAENLATSDSIMKALSALDFDSAGATEEDVEDNLSRAIEPTEFQQEDTPPPPAAIAEVDDLDDIINSSVGDLFNAPSDDDDDDGDGDITSDYISSLFEDNE